MKVMFYVKNSRERKHIEECGFTLIELGVVLIIIGLLVGAGIVMLRPLHTEVEAEKTEYLLEGVKASLVAFALANNRLPCADTNGDGYEGGGAGCGAASNAQTGSVPYATIGIVLSANPGQVMYHRDIVYGVYRNDNVSAAADADLAVILERTGDTLGDSSFQDVGDFRAALTNGAAGSASNSFVYWTGDGDVSVENCAANIEENGAFVLTTAGVADSDGDGSRFDGINANLALDGTGSRCFASPSRRKDATYDDVTIGMSFSELLAEMTGADVNK